MKKEFLRLTQDIVKQVEDMAKADPSFAAALKKDRGSQSTPRSIVLVELSHMVAFTVLRASEDTEAAVDLITDILKANHISNAEIAASQVAQSVKPLAKTYHAGAFLPGSLKAMLSGAAVTSNKDIATYAQRLVLANRLLSQDTILPQKPEYQTPNAEFNNALVRLQTNFNLPRLSFDEARQRYLYGRGTTPSFGKRKTAPAAPAAPPEDPAKREERIQAAIAKLDKLHGLESVKADVKRLKSMVKFHAARHAMGLAETDHSLHLVFTGNPGTGKTTIARIIGEIYKELGVLEKGHFVEVDRGELVGEYIGSTAQKTQEKIDEAMGGILFIDEAYALQGEGNDFGPEAIETILKNMEDKRGAFVVIVAGYPDLMKKFINSNPGLPSRFNKYIDFPDYNTDDLVAIMDQMATDHDLVIDPDARREAKSLIRDLKQAGGRNFGNGRMVRNMLEKLEMRMARRLFGQDAAVTADGAATEAEARKTQLMTITKDDLLCLKQEVIAEEKRAAQQRADTRESSQYQGTRIGFMADLSQKAPAPKPKA